MKRKVQSLGWLTVLFTFALLWASPLMAAEYMLQIVNTWVSDENCNDLSGIEGVKLAEGGEFKYIPSTKTLIMKNVTVSVNDDWKAIWNRGVEGLTIEVSGTNLLETAKGVLAIEKTTLITGSGTLSVKSSTDSDYAVFVGNTTLTISNITLDASGKYGVVGVLNSNNGKLLLKNTDVVATGTESAVFALESFTTEKCRIAAPVGGSFDGTKHAIVDKKGNRAKEVKIAKGDPVAVTDVTVEPTSAEVEVNKTLQLTIKVEPNSATNKNYTCISDNTSVATVSNAGLVTAVAEGTANITITTEDGNKTVSCTIKVIPATTVEDAVFASVVVSPNPFDTQLHILNGDLRGKYALCNTLGIDVISGILSDVQTQINTSSFPAGVYLLRLTAENGATKTFTVVKN